MAVLCEFEIPVADKASNSAHCQDLYTYSVVSSNQADIPLELHLGTNYELKLHLIIMITLSVVFLRTVKYSICRLPRYQNILIFGERFINKKSPPADFVRNAGPQRFL